MITLDIDSGAGPRRVDLCLVPRRRQREERAHEDAYAWIKALRHLRVDGLPFRRRFTFRGDSLWWFAELFLHKEQAILDALRDARGVRRAGRARAAARGPLCVGRPSPGVVAPAAAARARSATADPAGRDRDAWALLRMDARARALAAGARLVATAAGAPRRRARARRGVRAHARSGDRMPPTASAESYIGPVLRAIEIARRRRRLRYVGIGARTNFRARRWWDPAAVRAATRASVPIERYAPAAALAGVARGLPRSAPRAPQLCGTAPTLRAHAVIRGCDCWPLVREQLAGIALLQFPWSARAMDEAAAALAALEPEVARHLRRGRRVGTRARARMPPPRRAARGPAARVHLPPLAELPSRGRTKPSPIPPIRRIADFPFPARDAALRRARGPPADDGGSLSARTRSR